MTSRDQRIHILLAGLLAAGFLVASGAAGADSVARADPPGRVGRIAYTEGGVSFLPPGTDAWTWAARNYPVAPGESFWTGDDGRVQLQIGAVDMRLDNQTELDVLDLDYGEMRLALPQGSTDVRLWTTPRGGVTIATPAGDVRLDIQGLYRVDVGAPPADGGYPVVKVTVFAGGAWVPSPEGPKGLGAGQATVLYAGYDPQYGPAEDGAIDDWGRDLEGRSRWRPSDDASAALPGLADLDAAGDYVTDPALGRVWFPRDVPGDWAPYRYGRWAYVEPWGYTWIDDAPWGFAPFHYGRWAQFGGRWGWIPGRPTPEPVYAPALVTFLGGVGWSLGGSDAIGWIPLAPDEVYRPSYAVSDGYWRRMNAASVRPTIINSVTSETVVNRVFRNAPAATVVRTAAFGGGQPVRRAAIAVTADVIARAPVASAASRPPPSPAARLGLPRPAGTQGAAAPQMAARPPAALQAVQAAVAAPPTRTGGPPVIAGARLAPPAARPGAASPMGRSVPVQPQAPRPITSPSAATPTTARPLATSPPADRSTTARPPAPQAAPDQPVREGPGRRPGGQAPDGPAAAGRPVRLPPDAPRSMAPRSTPPQSMPPQSEPPQYGRPEPARPQAATSLPPTSQAARPEPARPQPAAPGAARPAPSAQTRPEAAPPSQSTHRQKPEPGDPRRPEDAGAPRP